ncbi:MAG: response regulator [Bacteroidota bacterium]
MDTNQPCSISPLRVLLVEDNDSYAFALVKGMAKYFHIVHAETETQAMRNLYTENYDILLLDLTLNTGYLSGFRFLEYIDRLDRFKNLIVIGLSGMALDDIYADASFGKLAAFLTKPVTAEDLIQTIEQCVLKAKGSVETDKAEETADLE